MIEATPAAAGCDASPIEAHIGARRNGATRHRAGRPGRAARAWAGQGVTAVRPARYRPKTR